MKRFLLYELLIVLTLTQGCTKDSGSPSPSNKVKTITTKITSISYNLLTTNTLSYDTQDRLVKAQSDSSTSIFTYEDNVIKKDVYEAGQPDQHLYYHLNAMGLSDSVLDYFGSADTIHWYFHYNTNNQLVQENWFVLNGWSAYRDTSFFQYNSYGDISTVSDTHGGMNTYEYFDTRRPASTADMLNTGLAPAKNLLKKRTFTISSQGFSVVSNFTYELDKAGRILSETEDLGYETIVTSYTYY